MLSKNQIDEYNEVGAIVVPDILTADEVRGCAGSPTSSSIARAT